MWQRMPKRFLGHDGLVAGKLVFDRPSVGREGLTKRRGVVEEPGDDAAVHLANPAQARWWLGPCRCRQHFTELAGQSAIGAGGGRDRPLVQELKRRVHGAYV